MTGAITLLALLEQDGVELSGTGNERKALCPLHDEKTPSFFYNVEKALFHCKGCGIGGDAVTYLEASRNITKRQALDLIKPRDGTAKDTPKANKPKAKPPATPARKVSAMPTGYSARYDYVDDDGVLRFAVFRWDKDGKKRIFPFTPASHRKGKWIAAITMKGKRPIYRLHDALAAPPERQIIIVEGEKCADAMADPAVAGDVVVSWAGGTSGWKHTDWAPLFNRRVALIADADDAGRKCMREIASHLDDNGAKVRIALPAESEKKGKDVADILAERGVSGMTDWIKSMIRDYPERTAPAPTPEPAPDLPPTPPDDLPPPPASLAERMERNPPFQVLGTVNGDHAVIKNKQHHIFVRSFEGIQRSNSLIAIAPRAWWMERLGGALSRVNAEQAGDIIIRKAEQSGEVAMERFIGRGAALINGKVIYHLGDRLLIDGHITPLDTIDGWIFLPRVTIDLPPVNKSEPVIEWRKEMAKAVLLYRWKTPAHGKRYLGWLVASIIGGALEWRPHLWMCEEAQGGKSWLIKNTAKPLFDRFYIVGANITPAGAARRIATDAMPLILEESEPDDSYINELLPILRIAAGEEGERLRADNRGGVTIERPRFSAAVLSTKLPRLNAANQSRFVFCEFKTKHDNERWLEVEQAITTACSAERMSALRGAIIRDTALIAAAAKKASRRLQLEYGASTRAALIGGALAAGYWWLSGEADLEWANTKHTAPNHDAISALRLLLDSVVRLTTGAGTSVRTVEITVGSAIRQNWDSERRQEPIRAMGIYYEVNEGLIIAPKHTSIEKIMRGTPFQKVDISALLRAIKGTKVSKNAIRFGGVRHRAVIIPADIVEGILDLTATEIEPHDDLHDLQD